MANPIKGEVSFECQGKQYKFVLGTYARVVLESASGKSWSEFWANAKKWKDTDLFHLFGAGLARHHEDLGAKEMSDLMDELGAQRTVEIVNEAIVLAAPEVKGKGRPPKAKPA